MGGCLKGHRVDSEVRYVAIDAVPMQSRAPFSWTWVGFLARVVLAVLAMWVLHLAQGRYQTFLNDIAAMFRFNWSLWLGALGASALAGLLFGLAVSFPSSRIRYAWNRLLFAVLVSLPLFEFWLVQGYLLRRDHVVRGWLSTTSGWFGGPGMQLTLAVLAGAAVASGFRAVDDRPLAATARHG